MSALNLEPAEHFNEAVATLGDRLQAARRAKGLTVESLATKLGLAANTIESWENDSEEPSANRFQSLSGLLSVSIVWLITGESDGTSRVAETYERHLGINDALGEISQLKASLSAALDKLENLEKRLQES